MLSLTLYQRKLLLRLVTFSLVRLHLASEYNLSRAPTDVYQTLFSGFLSLLVSRTVSGFGILALVFVLLSVSDIVFRTSDSDSVSFLLDTDLDSSSIIIVKK